MITRVRKEKKCESDREVDYDITISKKEKKEKYGSNVMMRTRRNQKKTHRDTKKKRRGRKVEGRKKNYVYKKQQKKGTGPKSVSDMVYRTPRERENGGIRIRKKTRIYWAAPGLGLSV